MPHTFRTSMQHFGVCLNLWLSSENYMLYLCEIGSSACSVVCNANCIYIRVSVGTNTWSTTLACSCFQTGHGLYTCKTLLLKDSIEKQLMSIHNYSCTVTHHCSINMACTACCNNIIIVCEVHALA